MHTVYTLNYVYRLNHIGKFMISQDVVKNSKKDSLINMRVHSHTRDFIDQAAKSVGKVRSDFVLEAAYEKAQEVLLDKQLFILDDAQWKAFNQILNEPPKANKKLLKLLNSPSPW